MKLWGKVPLSFVITLLVLFALVGGNASLTEKMMRLREQGMSALAPAVAETIVYTCNMMTPRQRNKLNRLVNGELNRRGWSHRFLPPQCDRRDPL